MAAKHVINPVHLDIMQSDEDTCIELAKQGKHEELDGAISGMMAFTKAVMNKEPRTVRDKSGYLSTATGLFRKGV